MTLDEMAADMAGQSIVGDTAPMRAGLLLEHCFLRQSPKNDRNGGM
jgi:hypothetical protein